MAIDWSKVFENVGGYLSDNASTVAASGLGAGGLALALRGYEDIGDIGQQAYEAMSGYTTESGEYVPGLADKLSGMLEFQPYTVTSATGGQFGMVEDPVTGQMTYQLATSPEEQLLQKEQLKRAETLFGRAVADPSAREQEVLGRMEDLASPERQRQRLALEQRLAAQGRLGTRTGMFGGTPEALALERGIAEAQNKAALDAMQFTAQEQQRQAQMGSGMLAAGYVPQAQLLNALQPSMTAAERQRQAISQQAGTYGQTYASGLEALLQAGLGQANIAGGVGGRIASAALGGLFS
jgi:hypothetical protein